jgi:hypothetical protein
MAVYMPRLPRNRTGSYPWIATTVLTNGVTAAFRLKQADKKALERTELDCGHDPRFLIFDCANKYRVAINIGAIVLIQIVRDDGTYGILSINHEEIRPERFARQTARVWATTSRAPFDVALIPPSFDVASARPGAFSPRNLGHFLNLQAVSFSAGNDDWKGDVLYSKGPKGEVAYIQPRFAALIVAPLPAPEPGNPHVARSNKGNGRRGKIVLASSEAIRDRKAPQGPNKRIEPKTRSRIGSTSDWSVAGEPS